MSRRLVLLALLACLAACGVKAPNYDYASEPDPRNTEYILGVGDQLTISVWQNADLTADVTVRPDGTITMPLVGDVKANGETPTSLKQTIQTRLAAFQKVDDTSISVSVRGFNSYRFTVAGEVTQPGVFTQGFYVTVAEAVALAGGFTRFAKRNAMTLQRRDPKSGEIRVIPLTYDLLASGKRPDMNIVLLAGDSLYVP